MNIGAYTTRASLMTDVELIATSTTIQVSRIVVPKRVYGGFRSFDGIFIVLNYSSKSKIFGIGIKHCVLCHTDLVHFRYQASVV